MSSRLSATQCADRPPPTERIFGRGIALGVGYAYWRGRRANWQTMVFTTLILAQIWLVLAMRSQRDSLWRIGLLSNKPLLGAVALTLVLQIAVISIPIWQDLFKTMALLAGDFALSLALSIVIFWCSELENGGSGPGQPYPASVRHRSMI